jgi:adenylate cyclase
MDSSELQRVRNWLIDGPGSVEPVEMITEFCKSLVAAGLPVWRFGIFIRTLHPEVFGRNFIWRQGQEVEIGSVAFDVLDSPVFARSPLRIVFEQALEVRGRATDPDDERFPFLDDMLAEGATDYIAVPMPFLDGSVHATSWVTRHPGGFSDDDIAAIRAIIAPLARVSEIISQRRTAEMLLDTYVGNRAGARILGGQIRRGHTDTMQAAIWLSDLRGFTALSDRLPAETVVEILNGYFDCQVSAILAHGGEVLKFMGDGLLAVFPIDE